MADAARAYLGITEMGRLLRRRETTPLELTQAYLARIEALDPKLHAFALVGRERALGEAQDASEEIRLGRWRGPLHGIPYAVKDLLATASLPTSWGAVPYRQRLFDDDATVVTRLREAGAVLLGKLAMIELAGGLGYDRADASATGAARNPWDTGRWTCGSSSGAGTAAAAGLVGFAIGSETWGSIVCPSSFCGVSGMRPTYGRVSRHGAMALSWTMDKIGPMARSALDCEIVLDVIAGKDPADPTSLERPFAPRDPEEARFYRAGLVMPESWKDGDPAVKAAVEESARALEREGLAVLPAKLPELPLEEAAVAIITSEATTAFEDLFRTGRVRELVDPGAPLARATAAVVTGADYVKAMRVRTLAQREMNKLFERFDVLLAPGEIWAASPVEKKLSEALPGSDPLGAAENLCGLPGIAVPCGFTPGGLPIGLRIVGPPLGDARVLAAARLFQTATDWHARRPPV